MVHKIVYLERARFGLPLERSGVMLHTIKIVGLWKRSALDEEEPGI